MESSETKISIKKPRSVSHKATLADVGKLAGVSSATVSMILSGRDDVSFSNETVVAVREAANSLHYKTVAGRRLAHFVREATGLDKSMILIVCPTVLNPYYNTLIQAIQQSAAQKNCDSCVYITYRSREGELAALHLAENGGFAGIVFTMIAYPERRSWSFPTAIRISTSIPWNSIIMMREAWLPGICMNWAIGTSPIFQLRLIWRIPHVPNDSRV